MTKSEVLKSLDNKQLAEVLMCPYEYDDQFKKPSYCGKGGNMRCIKCIEDWLNSENRNERLFD